MKLPLYLDANSHVPMSKATLRAYSQFNDTLAAHGHPLSPSVAGRAAASAIEESRATIAKLIGAERPEQIVFTNSCTQACQWLGYLLDGGGNCKYDLFPGGKIHCSPIEHPAMEQAIRSELLLYEVDSNGTIVPGDEELEFGVCIHMQNEIGTIQPIADLPDTWIISDMSQSLGKMEINVTELNVDHAVFGGHKFGGPSGVGFMYFKDTGDWEEFGTGSRYFMDIPGTPNVNGIVATAAALDESAQTLERRREKMVAFQDRLEPGLKELGFEIIGEGAERCHNTTFVKVPGTRNAGLILMTKLGKLGIHVGLGSACGSIYAGGSPLMEALGKPSDGQDYIRISQFGSYGAQEASFLIRTISQILKI